MRKFCRNCGTQLSPDTKFCGSCGTPFVLSDERQIEEGVPPFHYQTNAASVKKRKAPSKKVLIPVIAAILVLAVGIGLFTHFTGDISPYEEGFFTEVNIHPGKQMTLGNLEEAGWELDIPENAFAEEGILSMRVLSEDEAKNYQSDGFTFYSNPMEIKLGEKENVRLGEPISVMVQIPKDLLQDLAAEELFFAIHYDGRWEYFIPDNIDLDKGTASAEIYHFSLFGFGKPSEEEQIETFAKNYAILQWESERREKQLTEPLIRQFDYLIADMGVRDNSYREQLTLDIINYLESEHLDTGDMSPIATMANLASGVSQGLAGKEDVLNQLVELTGRAIYKALEKDVEQFSNLANVAGGLSTAVGAIIEEDTEGAMEGIMNTLRGASPKIALADAALRFTIAEIQYNIDYWSQGEIEKAYQVYIGARGRFGFNPLHDRFESVFIDLSGGGYRQMRNNIINRHVEKFGIDEDDLSEADRERIVSNAKTALRRHFDERKIADAEIARLQQSAEAFIAELKNQNLLSAFGHEKFFRMDWENFDIKERLRRLYTVKSTVLGIIDKEVAEKISYAELAEVISQWVWYNEEGNREGFFQRMIEWGYIKPNLIPSMEELAGIYEDGSFTIEKVHVSEKLMAEARRIADDPAAAEGWEGCDFVLIGSLLELEGQTQQAPFTITVVSEVSGALQFDHDGSVEVDTSVPTPFIYNPDDGTMAFDITQDRFRSAGSLSASFIEESKVEVSGTLRVTALDMDEKDFYMDISMAGTKLLGAQ